MTPALLHAGNPGPFTGEGNWTYLIGGEKSVLIDAGVGDPRHLAAIAAAVHDGPAAVVVTHAHDDHASGAAAIEARWPNARFAKFPWPGRDRHVRWQPLGDGDRVETDAGDLEVLHTPGHSPDHVALWHAETRTLFTGDLLVLGSTVFIPASDGGSLADYMRSLERLLGLAPDRAWPAHGPVIDDPQLLIRQYLRHRGEREQQVVSALEAGDADVDRIARRIYTDLVAALMPMARESVLAHLIKLESEGRARRRAGAWAIVR